MAHDGFTLPKEEDIDEGSSGFNLANSDGFVLETDSNDNDDLPELQLRSSKKAKLNESNRGLVFLTSAGISVDVGLKHSELMKQSLLSDEPPQFFNIFVPKAQQVDDVMEMFAPPRLLAVSPMYGLHGDLSMDILNGWNLRLLEVQRKAFQELSSRQVRFLLLCPPCRFWSTLMASNWGRMGPTSRREVAEEGIELLQFSVHCMRFQACRGALYCYENPGRAGSLKQPSIEDLPQAKTALFDMCMVGLTTPAGVPVKKRTALKTNSPSVHAAFDKLFCNGFHKTHQICEGKALTSHCSRYPTKFMHLMAEAVAKDLQ
jgi:hypothetical protein